MENQKVKAMMVFEMIGRPANHLSETMHKFIDTIGAEKGVKIINKNIHEPKKVEEKDKVPLKDNQELYSTFCELELETQHIMGVVAITFKYLPAHVEIIEPENTELSNLDFGAIINEIVLKMHNYDAIAKSAIMQNQMLAEKLKEIMAKHPEDLGSLGLKEINVSQKTDFEKEAEKGSKKSKKKSK